MMTEQKKKNQKQLNKAFALTGVAAQMGITIFLGAYLGKYLDVKFPADKKWFTMILVIVAVIISLYNVIKQLDRINEKHD
jgi:membrane protein DedA with SNARE-associated domain